MTSRSIKMAWPAASIGEHDMGRWRRILVAAAMVGGGLGTQAAFEVAAANPAGATTAMTFFLSPCAGSGATGNGSVAISQTAKSLSIIDRISNDRPDAGDVVVLYDVNQGFPFGSFSLNTKGSALFEAHQTTTTPTGINSGDSIVLADLGPTGESSPIIVMASDTSNCFV